MTEKRAEIVAATFYETMYPSQKWAALPRKSSMKAMMLHAADRVVERLSMPIPVIGDLFATEPAAKVVIVDQWPADYCDKFWQAYPHKVGKADALAALKKLHNKSDKEKPAFAVLLGGLRSYIESKPDDRPWCNPGTWLRQHRWLDQPAPAVHNGARQRGNGFATIAAMAEDE
jgi:hypothetical protein